MRWWPVGLACCLLAFSVCHGSPTRSRVQDTIPQQSGLPFDALTEIDQIVEFVKNFEPQSRFADMLDLYGGHGTMSKTFNKYKHATLYYDARRDPSASILCRDGFYKLLALILMINVGGLIMAGPPCSLFIYLSSSYHRRSKLSIFGDTTKAAVHAANLIVSNT